MMEPAPPQVPEVLHEQLGDREVKELLGRYSALAAATLTERGPNLFDLDVPAADRKAFAGRDRIRLAFSVEAMLEEPEAEIAIVGSAFVEQLIAVIRSHGTRHDAGRFSKKTRSDDVSSATDRKMLDDSAIGV